MGDVPTKGGADSGEAFGLDDGEDVSALGSAVGGVGGEGEQ
jgi:hypothetical protein